MNIRECEIVGEAVEANWKGQGAYYSGHVTAVNGSAQQPPAERTFAVRYDDGDIEYGVVPSRMRKPSKRKRRAPSKFSDSVAEDDPAFSD